MQAFGCFDLGVQAGLGFVDEVAVVLPFDAAFEAEGDEKADGDGQEMNRKLASHELVHGEVSRSREGPLRFTGV